MFPSLEEKIIKIDMYMLHLDIIFSFTFMQLADAFIQTDHTQYVCSLIEPTTFASATFAKLCQGN